MLLLLLTTVGFCCSLNISFCCGNGRMFVLKLWRRKTSKLNIQSATFSAYLFLLVTPAPHTCCISTYLVTRRRFLAQSHWRESASPASELEVRWWQLGGCRKIIFLIESTEKTQAYFKVKGWIRFQRNFNLVSQQDAWKG